MFRFPVNTLILFDECVFDARHGEVPRIVRVVEERGLTAPAKWIRVLDDLLFEKRAASFQLVDDIGVGIFDKLAREQSDILREFPVLPHQMIFGQPDFRPKFEVVGAVHNRRVHDTRAVFGRDKIRRVHLVRVLHLLAFFLRQIRLSQKRE